MSLNYRFDEFEVDTGLFELRRSGAPVPLEPQVFSVLAYLVEHAERVVLKTELLDAVWGDRFISDAALTSRLMAARKALGDSGQEQRYIKTVHGRGYRFVGEIATDGAPRRVAAPASVRADAPAAVAPPPAVVGRAGELAHLRECFELARGGGRQLVFVTGEAGLGKSTLVDAFLASLQPGEAHVAVGGCVEQRGVGEPYMPAIEAVGRLCEAGGPEVVATMMRRAPTWLMQVPWLLADEDVERLRERVLMNTRERMLREAAEAMEELTASVPLVLVLEDLHWADQATLDLVNWIGRRREPCRLLLIGTYRPGAGEESGVAALQRELRVRGLCHELALALLAEDAVRAYVEARAPGMADTAALSDLLLQRTDGNPLFARAILEEWVATGALAQDGGGWRLAGDLDALRRAVPESLRGLIAGQLARLSADDRAVADAAAIAGSPFSAAALAAVLGRPAEEIEAACERMRGGGGMLRAAGEARGWPGREDAAAYAFVHALYEEVVYGAVTPARRSRLHQEMGEQIERAAGGDAESYAVELARHFRQGGDAARAIRYLQAAADQAIFRGAHREGAEHLEAALALVPDIPDTRARALQEAEIQSMLAGAVIVTQGFGAPDAENAYKRAMELAAGIDDRPRRAALVFGLAALLEYQAKHAEAAVLLEQIEEMGISDREVRIPYHALRACSAFHRGLFPEAIDHGEEGLRLQRPGDTNHALAFMGEDPMLGCREWSGLALWFMGFPESALHRMTELLELAARLDRRYAYASALSQATRLHQMRTEPEAARERAEQAIASAEEYGFTYHLASSRTVLGWAMAALGDAAGGLEQLRAGLDLHQGTGAAMDRPYYLCLLADALHRTGDGAAALPVIDDALDLIARSDAPFFYEPELRRLRGEILHALGLPGAEESARAALAMAERQQARSLALRAATTIVEMGGGEAKEDRARLAALLGSFTEGRETVDQERARRALEAPPARGRRRASR